MYIHIIYIHSYLYQKSQDISIDLGLLDQLGSKVVGTDPFAEFPNVLTVQGNSLPTNLVQLVRTEDNLGTIDSRREDSEFSHRSHLKTGSSSSGGARIRHGLLRSLRDNKGGSSIGSTQGWSESVGAGQYKGENKGKREGLHGVNTVNSS